MSRSRTALNQHPTTPPSGLSGNYLGLWFTPPTCAHAAGKSRGLFDQTPASAWHKPLVVYSQLVGSGSQALTYLSRYLLRVAISNTRILAMDNGQVTFQFKEREAGQQKIRSLPAEEFIRRFLQHVLPKGFGKACYYGFFGTAKQAVLKQLRILLLIHNPAVQPSAPLNQAHISEAGIPLP